MSDDETKQEEEAPAPEPEPQAEPEPEPEPAPKVEEPPKKPKHQVHHEELDENGMTETQRRMEEEKVRRKAKMEEDMKEYEEMRKEERERLETEIRELRQRRETRKKEREEEEKRIAEQRAVENQERRAEEEERQRRKREEEAKRKEEREKKRLESEERSKALGRPNFIISKKSGSDQVEVPKTGATGEEGRKEGKSKEQLEAEKKSAMEQRQQPLKVDGFSQEQLAEKAKELFNRIYDLEGDKYDLEQRFKTQNMDILELQERARQMAKGGAKNAKVNTAPDPLADKIQGLAPKVVMYSQYERIKDPRSFVDRRDLFSGPLYGIEYERIAPSNKVVLTEHGPRVVGEHEGGDHGGHDAPPAAEEVTAEE